MAAGLHMRVRSIDFIWHGNDRDTVCCPLCPSSQAALGAPRDQYLEIYPKSAVNFQHYYNSLEAENARRLASARMDSDAYRRMREQLTETSGAALPSGPSMVAPPQPILPNPFIPPMPPPYRPAPIITAQRGGASGGSGGVRPRMCPWCNVPRKGHPKSCPNAPEGGKKGGRKRKRGRAEEE